MTFRRMSRGFVCSSQRDKERDLNKSIYPCWPSTQPTFCPECSQCCAAGWHHETSQQPKSAMGLSFPIILGNSAGCTSLGPWPEGRCWALGRESHCKAVAVDERCSLESSLLLPFLEHSFSSKLTHVFGLQSPRNGPYIIFPVPTCGGHPPMQGWGGLCTPRVAVQSFCYLSFAGDSLLSSLCDSPPCLDMIRLIPLKNYLPKPAILGDIPRRSLVQKREMLKTPEPSPALSWHEDGTG